MTPQHIIESSKLYFKIEGKKRITLLPLLSELDIWNQMDVWNNMFTKLCCIDKELIYREVYGLDLPSRWNLFNKEQQDRFRDEETQRIKISMKSLLETMHIVQVSDTTIKKFVGYSLSQFRFDEKIRKEIEEIALSRCNIITESIENNKERALSKMRELYNAVYLTEE
ncbi:DENN domain containing protein [Entamoeba nuttalli P19]|uniref:DENN domain containing protein n=2 Tax=Entamoeba nuttalli TaxID=412467 RepID=K2GEF2_ENTNP|nr:DENN domain containing protein [Entamoeba nuttalli P19]EKE40991.1 DENN domain containing protein [Entamoeba nuttalli P19]|eukprot:XP_008856675.1 DENN domain containing protein [Entamoeba nuttalli P19]